MSTLEPLIIAASKWPQPHLIGLHMKAMNEVKLLSY